MFESRAGKSSGRTSSVCIRLSFVMTETRMVRPSRMAMCACLTSKGLRGTRRCFALLVCEHVLDGLGYHFLVERLTLIP